MNRGLGSLVLLGLLLGAVGVRGEVSALKTSPPEFIQVWSVDRDKGTLTLTVQEYEPVTKEITVTVERDGRKFLEKRAVMELVGITKQILVPVKDLQASDGAGKKLAGEDLLKRVKAGQVVLATRDPKGVDPAYRAVLSPEAIILVLPTRAPRPPR